MADRKMIVYERDGDSSPVPSYDVGLSIGLSAPRNGSVSKWTHLQLNMAEAWDLFSQLSKLLQKGEE